ncbi:MAG: 50S ribosomal protein L23 [Phycisphaerae bacterium]|nr:50S ribosomal protein L23 [Phycisphaerae bacterium]
MDLYHTIIRPLVTEKSTHQARQETRLHGGTYSFEVHPEANKAQVKDAVEKIYGVKVVNVRTSNRPGKVRRYRYKFGHTRQTKKAIITVDKDSHIDLF